MRAMLLNAMNSLIKFARTRWIYLATFAVAMTLLTTAAYTESLVLALAGAVAAFVAGEEKAAHYLCNECALEMVVADPEIPERYTVA
ncbi:MULTISPECIES: hypothetical protein [unclassified Nonomuraea]|uniref:hypothetical protein n=1 Tax=unclassified Nonomuraea TaxID=2593643 RepID=UPI0033E6D922